MNSRNYALLAALCAFAGSASAQAPSNATLGVKRISRRNGVESTAQTAHGITEKKIYMSRVLEGIAEVGAFDTISRDRAAERRTMALFVLFPENAPCSADQESANRRPINRPDQCTSRQSARWSR
jgi:hypothetical protein